MSSFFNHLKRLWPTGLHQEELESLESERTGRSAWRWFGIDFMAEVLEVLVEVQGKSCLGGFISKSLLRIDECVENQNWRNEAMPTWQFLLNPWKPLDLRILHRSY